MIKENHKQRIKWLDFAKGITIFFVVFGHTLEFSNLSNSFINYLVFTFIMPIFFAISGFLYKPNHNIHGYILLLYKKFGSFLIPYLFFSLLIVSEKVLTGKLQHFIINIILPFGYLWFFYALILIFMIIGVESLFHINIYIQIICIFILFVLQEYIFNYEGIQNINIIRSFFGFWGYFLSFYIGVLIHRLNFSRFISKLKNLVILIILISWIFIVLMQYSFTYVPRNNTNLFWYSDSLTKFLSIIVFFIIFINFNHNKFFKYFDKWGQRTLVIYLVHLPLLSNINKVLKRLIPSGSNIKVVYFIVLLIIVWELSIFVCYLVSKIKFINFIFYPRKYINKFIINTKWGRKLLSY